MSDDKIKKTEFELRFPDRDIVTGDDLESIINDAIPLPFPEFPGEGPDQARIDAESYVQVPGVLAREVADPLIMPFSSVGRFLFKFPNNPRPSVATAWRGGQNGIVTAAHCAFDRSAGGSIQWGIFVPWYDGVQRREGYQITAGYWHDLWESYPFDEEFDIATFNVTPVLPQTVPILSTPVNWIGATDIRSIGYPAERPFNGRTMYYCIGPGVRSYMYPREYAWMRNNDMTGGCSGGPWIYYPGEAQGQYAVVGLNSNSKNGIHTTKYSPEIPGGLFNYLVRGIQ